MDPQKIKAVLDWPRPESRTKHFCLQFVSEARLKLPVAMVHSNLETEEEDDDCPAYIKRKGRYNYQFTKMECFGP
ncbi:hypothetical protein AAFF_G00327210 [Aldrovandia affinis]|uniref:Uncharacterized protein n=1 Tax=Aldrovandia affinis TaxID=143900 RepID=A0AAD7T9V5_9TELE|nr:hypothetical protein AAFF_G00327210 [Aldrovandia affinis]